MSKKYKKSVPAQCLRLALQELGPVWIKLGQMLSTRHDLLPNIIIKELTLLQDKVKPFNDALNYIEKSMGNPIEKFFNNFEKKPLASASISQVHSANLKSGEEVVIKVIRPDVLHIIKSDIRLMYRIARLIPYFLHNSYNLKTIEIVSEYEKSLLQELNLLYEAANTTKLRSNFKNSHILYIPKVYPEYCSRNIMVMERIYGTPIKDINSLKSLGVNMKLLAERGIEIFFTQVFYNNFFHGDMHPGNIFINLKDPDNPKYILIDCGIIGSLSKKDVRYLAENFIAFFNRDYRKVAELHIDSGWVSPDTNIEYFEFTIRNICEPFFKKPISEISFGYVLFSLFKNIKYLNVEIQPQLILLQKTLLYAEGISKQLYPKLDLWKTAKPFLENWMKNQIKLPNLINFLKDEIPFFIRKLPEVSEIFYSIFKNKALNKKNNILFLKKELILQYQSKFYFLLFIGTISLMVGILFTLKKLCFWYIYSLFIILGAICYLIAWKTLNILLDGFNKTKYY